MSIKQAKHMFVIVIAAVGVIVAMMVLKFVSSRMGCAAKPQQLPVPEASFSPFEVRVRTVKRNTMPLEQGTVVATSDAVAIVCGVDDATADLYEARNDALRSLMRSRRLTKEDAAALLDYLASTNDQLRAERVAALKNDVMNLQRRQETPVAGLAETLTGMFDGGAHPRASAATARRCLFCARRCPLPAATPLSTSSPSAPSGFGAILPTFRDYRIL